MIDCMIRRSSDDEFLPALHAERIHLEPADWGFRDIGNRADVFWRSDAVKAYGSRFGRFEQLYAYRPSKPA